MWSYVCMCVCILSLCMCVCVCLMCVRMHVPVCTYASMHVSPMHLCIYASIHLCMHACMHVCMNVCMNGCTVCMNECMHVCMDVWKYACMSVCQFTENRRGPCWRNWVGWLSFWSCGTCQAGVGVGGTVKSSAHWMLCWIQLHEILHTHQEKIYVPI